MIIKKCLVIGLSLIVVLVGVLAACAAPESTPTPTVTPTLTPTSTVSGPLAQIIAGAKKEGTVLLYVAPSAYTPKSMERLQAEVKERFGVDLRIVFTPATTYVIELSTAIMEYKAGATPTFDTYFGNPTNFSRGNEAGIFEAVDWKSLITADTNPAVVMENPHLRGAISTYNNIGGILYNPEKVPAPTTLLDLANPKYQGKIGLMNMPDRKVRRAFILGKDKVLAELRAIMMNKPMVAVYQDQYNRYLLGELWMIDVSSSNYARARQKDVPAAFQCVDYGEVNSSGLTVRKGALHPNAAKLVALYLASQAGAKFTLEEAGTGNLFYPGSYEYEIVEQAEKQGIPVFFQETYPGLLDYMVSDEAAQLSSQIDLIFKGAER